MGYPSQLVPPLIIRYFFIEARIIYIYLRYPDLCSENTPWLSQFVTDYAVYLCLKPLKQIKHLLLPMNFFCLFHNKNDHPHIPNPVLRSLRQKLFRISIFMTLYTVFLCLLRCYPPDVCFVAIKTLHIHGIYMQVVFAYSRDSAVTFR